MKGMILAAGMGTRLRPITNTVPKPMVPLCNRPLIGWAMESFLAAGITQLIVNLHHLPEPIEVYLGQQYAGKATIRFSYEQQILGTGGAIRRVRPLLENEEAFYLANGDTVQFPRWDALRDTLDDNIAVLTLRHPPHDDKFTAVWLENGRITGFGDGRGEPLMFAGSHLISTRLFDHLPDEDVFGIVDRVYQPLIDEGKETIAGSIDDGLWFDIGTPQRYASASRAMLEAIVRGDVAPPAQSHVDGDSLLHDTVRGSVTRSVVGARSIIRGEVRDSVIWEDCVIDGLVERCIVGHGVRVEGEHRDELIVRGGLVIVPLQV